MSKVHVKGEPTFLLEGEPISLTEPRVTSVNLEGFEAKSGADLLLEIKAVRQTMDDLRKEEIRSVLKQLTPDISDESLEQVTVHTVIFVPANLVSDCNHLPDFIRPSQYLQRSISIAWNCVVYEPTAGGLQL